MAEYYIDINGKVTKNKKKDVKPPSYIISLDGKVTKLYTDKNGNVTEGQKNTYLQLGALENGKVGTAVSATGVDIAEDATVGGLGFAEQLVDGMAQKGTEIMNYQMTTGMYTDNQFGPAIKALRDLLHPEVKDIEAQIVKNAEKNTAEFVKKDLINEKEIAYRNIVAPFEARTGIDMEASSVIGAKGDSLVQSASNMVARQLVSRGMDAIMPGMGVVVGDGLTYLSTKGAEAENAYIEGATFDEASASSDISGLVETGAEKLSGIKFGGKTLTDVATKGILRHINNPTLRKGAKLVTDTFGERIEEGLSYYGQSVGQHSTYRNDEEFSEVFNKEELKDNMEAGGILGALFGGGNIVTSKITGKDYVTGKSVDEQKVLDTLYKEDIAKREENGEKLTAKQKSDIYDNLERNIERGYIDIEVIERILGGDTYKSYQEAVANEEAIRQEYEELGKVSNPTLAQISRYNELSKQIEALKNSTTKSELKDKLGKEVFDVVKDAKLVESYNESNVYGKRNLQNYLSNNNSTKVDIKKGTTLNDGVQYYNNSAPSNSRVVQIPGSATENSKKSLSNSNENIGPIANQNVKGNNMVSKENPIRSDIPKALNGRTLLDVKAQSTNDIAPVREDIEPQKDKLPDDYAPLAEEYLNKSTKTGHPSTQSLEKQGESGKIESAENVKSSEQRNVKGDDTSSVLGEGGSDVAEDITEAARKIQKSIIESVENSAEGTRGLANLQKGNYGEMKMDDFFESQGYGRISTDRVTDLNEPTHQGIDGIYYNPDGHPPYIIGEAKYGSSKLGSTLDGKQMSDNWVDKRLVDAVGEEMADDIILEMMLNPDNVQKQLVNISTDGNVTTKILDEYANIVK